MKYTQLKKSLTEGVAPIYLLQGEELYFLDNGAKMFMRFVTEPSLNYTAFDGAFVKNNPKDFISAVYSFPFMSEKRLIKVSDYFPTEREFERVAEVFSSPCPTTILLIVNSSAGKGADLKKKPNVTFVDCSRADEEDVIKWIYITLKKAGIYADSSLCKTIADYCVMNMARVAAECEKLIEYVGEGGTLTAEDVDKVVYRDSDYKIYELTSAVARGNYSAFCTICDELMQKGFDEVGLLSSLSYYYKNLYDSLCLTCSDSEAAKILGAKEYSIKKNRQQARLMGKEKLKKYIDVFYTASSDIKNGRTSASSAFKVVTAKIFF